MEKLMKLKDNILSVPTGNVIFSSLINRFDDAETQFTICQTLDIPVIENNSITFKQLGKKGLQINPCGTGKLAINFIKMLMKLYHVSEMTHLSNWINNLRNKPFEMPIRIQPKENAHDNTLAEGCHFKSIFISIIESYIYSLQEGDWIFPFIIQPYPCTEEEFV